MNEKYITLNQLTTVTSALLNKFEEKVNETDLAEVAFTGSYNDLENRPNLNAYATKASIENWAINNDGPFMVKGTDYVTAGQASGSILGNKATVEGAENAAIGGQSHAEGRYTSAGMVASGNINTAHAEGGSTIAVATGSHAEGESTMAYSGGSHAEGYQGIAYGLHSHVEGYHYIRYSLVLNGPTVSGGSTYTTNCTVSPEHVNLITNGYAFIIVYPYGPTYIEGKVTNAVITNNVITEITFDRTLGSIAYSKTLYIPNAIGSASHAEGHSTIAIDDAQHAGGKYNIPVTGAEVIGGGTDESNPANIRVLDWSGNETLAGKLTVGANPVNNMDVVTKQYMESQGYLTLATLPVYDGTVVS